MTRLTFFKSLLAPFIVKLTPPIKRCETFDKVYVQNNGIHGVYVELTHKNWNTISAVEIRNNTIS